MKQSKTILFLTRLYHPYIGGVEKHVAELSKELIKKGYHITLITETDDNSLAAREVHNKINIHRITVSKKTFLKKFHIWFWLVCHLSILFKSDIIHIHDVFYWILPFRPFLIGKKLYITFHGYEGYPIRMHWIVQRKLAEYLTNGSICVGDFMKKWYKASPDYVIYGGVRLKKRNIIQKPRSAVFFGRLDSQTGILEYVKAYKKIKEKHADFTLTVVGEGDLHNKLPKDIRILPFKSDVNRYIQENRFIFVSRYLSMLEALVLKKEIIAVYDNPVKKDYLLMSPFKNYIEVAKNSDEIAGYVLENIENTRVKKEIIESGNKWSKENTWRKIADIYEKLWLI